MNLDDALKHDKETEKWLAEIESFRSPPPPRKLFGSNLIPSNFDADLLDSSENVQFSQARSIVEADCEKRLQKLNISPHRSTNNETNPKSCSANNHNKSSSEVCQVRSKNNDVSSFSKSKNGANIVKNEAKCSNSVSKKQTTTKLPAFPTTLPETYLQKRPKFNVPYNNAAVYDTPIIHKVHHSKPNAESKSFLDFTNGVAKNVKKVENPTETVVGARALELQQLKFLQFEAEIEKQLEKQNSAFGECYGCSGEIKDSADATQAMGRLYHTKCFTCNSCGRTLTGKKFYEANEKIYCEEDYLFSGYQEATERCAICGHFIMDMILQAVDKSFHPNCFRCSHCKDSLDGVPFTMDDKGVIYCVADYHRLFAPICAKCSNPITPSTGREETIRVVAMQKDYHIDCYVCEACGLQLTDDTERRCYPLADHLLCYECHLRWSGLDKKNSARDFLVSDV